MAKTREIFVCDQCGNESLQWQGLCPACGAGDTLRRMTIAKGKADRRPLAPGVVDPQRLSQVTEADEPRIATGLEELDRVLGGGLVLGSVTLLGGDPGIGKSTMLLQAGDALSRAIPTLYVTGEESLHQVALRARRLGVVSDSLQLLAETSVETIIERAQQARVRVLVIDSIQTMFAANVESSPGSASQVRESAAALVRFAKATGRLSVDHRSRDERGRHRRSAHPRTHGGHSALLRKRRRQSLPAGAGGQESVRRRKRSRRIRHD